jgi:type 1 fimbria pilin
MKKGIAMTIIPTTMMLLVIVICNLFSINVVTAEDNMSFRGSLMEFPPCKINDGKVIEINFGEIGVGKVTNNGSDSSLRKLVLFEIDCQDKLFIRYLGIPTSFDNAAVQSSVPDLGIQMQLARDNAFTPIVIGQGWVREAGSSGANTAVWALPVKKIGAELSVGSFEATATLQLEYP